jgi:plastocyanin
MKGGTVMKAIKFLLVVVCLSFLVVSYTTTGATQEKVIAGVQVIRLHHTTGIRPDPLTVNRGTTVIWINETMSPATIRFIDKKITTACENPVHFVKDADGSFMSDHIPFGSVASLCFVEKGTYKYTATCETRMVTEVQKGKIDTGKTFEGTIIVE